MPFLFEFLHFPCLDSPAKIGERRPLRNRGTAEEEFYYCVFLNLFACQITYCCTYGLLCTGRGIAVPRKSLVWRLRTVPTQDKLYQADSSARCLPFWFPRAKIAACSPAGQASYTRFQATNATPAEINSVTQNACRQHSSIILHSVAINQNDHGIPAQRNHE